MLIDVDYKILVAKNHREVEDQVKALMGSDVGWFVANTLFNNGVFIQVMVKKEETLIILKDVN